MNSSIKALAKVTIPALSISILGGCQSLATHKYQDHHSRAWNIAQSVGMTQLDDAEVPADQIDGHLGDGIRYGWQVSTFMTNPRWSMSLGDAAGFALLGLLTVEKGQGEDSKPIAWVPGSEADSKEEAHDWIHQELINATVSGMEEMEIEDINFNYKNRLKEQFLVPDAYETQVWGETDSGMECGAYIKTYPDHVLDKTLMPDFLNSEEKGYYMSNRELTNHPTFRFYCLTEGDFEPFLKFGSKISSNLPETMFLYTHYMEAGDNKVPPMVHDQGKILLFIVEEE